MPTPTSPPSDDNLIESFSSQPPSKEQFDDLTKKPEPKKKEEKPQFPQPTATYQTEVNHVIQGAGDSDKSYHQYIRKITLLAVFLMLISALAAGAIYVYNFAFNPLKIIQTALAKLENANSFSINATFAPTQEFGNASIRFDWQKSDLDFSRSQINLAKINDQAGHNLVIMYIFNTFDNYIQAYYSEIDSVDNQLKLVFPQISSLKSYNLILPVLKGQKWLHFKASEEEQDEGGIQISKDKERQLNEKFDDSIVVRSHERNFIKLGNKYNKIILGFDKEKLVEFIEEFKTLDLEIELKDINSLIKIVQSVESWNEDLIIILVDKETGNFHSISLSIPQIPKDALEAGVQESVSEESGVSAFANLLTDKISGLLEKPTSANLIYIGELIVSNFNTAPKSKRPSPVVESDELMLALNNDLPLLMQALILQMQGLQPEVDIYSPELFNTSPRDVLGETDTPP